MKRHHYFTLIIGSSLIFISIWAILNTLTGLNLIINHTSDPPITLITPKDSPESRPLVLTGHGFAGSRQNMQGFALTLAHAGYSVVIWDFAGHGYNPKPYPSEINSENFLEDAERAFEFAKEQDLAKFGEHAILGHSMGSGVALTYGQKYPDTRATIAVSPVSRSVTSVLPQNLLIMAGSNEPAFVKNAEDLLTIAGGPGGLHDNGTARSLAIIPGVEHISILFAPRSHQLAVDWLDATFGMQSGARNYIDSRIFWWGIALLGTMLIAYAVGPLTASRRVKNSKTQPFWRSLVAILGGALGATLCLWILDLAGIELSTILKLLAGGYLLIWFGIAGVISMLIFWQIPIKPSRRDLSGGLVGFLILWLGVGLLTHLVWMNWLLIPKRLFLWPLGAMLVLPWFLVIGNIVQGKKALSRLGLWALYSISVCACLFLGIQLNSGLRFLIIILPMIPFILGLQALVAGSQRGAWQFAISGSLWVSWALIAVFPLG